MILDGPDRRLDVDTPARLAYEARMAIEASVWL
jgi:hypothetical protein